MKLIEALRAYTKIVQAKLDATILHSHNLTKGEAREEVIRDIARLLNSMKITTKQQGKTGITSRLSRFSSENGSLHLHLDVF